MFFKKNATITDWKKCAVLIGIQLGMYSHLMLNKPEGKKSWKKKKRNLFKVKASSFRDIVWSHSGQCMVQY